MAFFRRTSSPAAGKRRRRIRKLRLLAILAVLGLLCAAMFLFGLVRALSAELPQYDPSRQATVSQNSVIYAADGRSVLAVLRGDENRVIVPSDAIGPVMKQAIVAIEDRRFYEHRGVDLRGILRAVWADVRHRSVVEGGSTITQQFVKNAIVRDSRSVARKLKEAAVAWQLEQRWSKDKILTAYLNTIYFGNGAYGVEQASRTYFGHAARRLTLAEAALLAGIPQDPTLYDPVTHPERSRERRAAVLRAMLEERDITYPDFRAARRAPVPRPADVRPPGTLGKAPYFANFVKQQLVERYGSPRVLGGGLHVRTTIDLRLQEQASAAVARWLPADGGPTAALVALDPRDGRVLAMVGGRNYRRSQFNLAVQGERQPGSAFKPLVLATALRQGISPASTFVSKPVTISLGDRAWPVRNYEDSYLGTVDLFRATEQSDNAVYAQLTQVVSPREVVRTARALGIRSPLRSYFAIGLGAEAVNPLELARAYAVFANDGARVDGSLFGNSARAILSVDDAENRVVDRRVLGRTPARIVTEALQRVVSSGTGVRAGIPGRAVAGKTGTTENYGDAWFVGYTPQLVVAVWVGYPAELRPMLTEFGGEAVSGGTYPALIWKTFAESALRTLQAPPESFPSPDPPGVTYRRVALRPGGLALDNGYCRNSLSLAFFDGYGPRRTADCKPNEVTVPQVVGAPVSEARAELEAQPLEAAVVYQPAQPRQPVGVVLRQDPARGTLSSHDTVRLVVAKPMHGVVPRVVGAPVAAARVRLRSRDLRPVVRFVPPRAHERPGTVIEQQPRAGVAAAPSMPVTLVVAGQPLSAA